jgi:hypothetical protein
VIRRLAIGVVLAAAAFGAARRSAAADEREAIGADLVKAAGRNDLPRLAAALDRAGALAGKADGLPDLGAVADWLGGLPGSVTSHRTVAVRRGWMYVTAKRGADAVPILEGALAAAPADGVARAYLGEARRQASDPTGAARDLGQALRDGAPEEFVKPSLSKLLFDLRREPVVSKGMPAYATAAAAFLAASEAADVRLQIATWLAFDAEGLRQNPEQTALLYGTAIRHVAVVIGKPPEGFSIARTAYHASEWRKAMGDAAPADLPDRYDLLATAVRAGSASEPDEVPEAVAALAEVALEEGRYALAHAMARRRLGISDSPAARRVLLALPPDVGR